MPDTIRRLSDELARDPSSLVFMPLADALRRAGQLDVALRVAVRGLERHPYLADAHDVLARIHVDRGDLQRAADEWEMALRLDPAHGPARKGLGFIDYRRGDLESAERRLSGASGDADAGVAAALAHVRSARSVREEPMAAGNGHAHAPDSEAPVVDRAAADAALGGPEPGGEPGGEPSGESRGERRGEARHEPRSDTEPDHAAGHGAARATPSTLRAASPAPRALFHPILEANQSALLVDEDGLVLAGSYLDDAGEDVAEVVGAELAGVSGEAERAMRHLGLGAWTSVLVEADAAVVALTPAPRGSLLVVAASRETPVGLVRLLLDRARARARDWLVRLS